jgi:hypothetical protein
MIDTTVVQRALALVLDGERRAVDQLGVGLTDPERKIVNSLTRQDIRLTATEERARCDHAVAHNSCGYSVTAPRLESRTMSRRR